MESNVKKIVKKSEVDLNAEVARLRAENEALRSSKTSPFAIKVSAKGAVSIYGLGRFPVTLYREQWERLLGRADAIRAFLIENAASLSVKGVIKSA